MIAMWAALGLGVLAGLVLLLWAMRRSQAPAPGLAADLRWIFTTHARQRMLQRGISRDQVEQVLVAPDRVQRDDREDSMRFEKDFESMLVKVWVVADPWPPIDQVVVKTTAVQHVASLKIPPRTVGRIIGRGGSTIRSVQDRTNAKIVVGKGDGVVRVRADDRRSVEQAVRVISDIAVNGTSRFSGT